MPTIATVPTPTRGHKKKARTRRQLIAAAVDVIAERGEAFSVSDVVARAGVANGTFYNYFPSRDALIEAIVPEVVGSFAAQSAVTVAEDDPAVRFASISALALASAEAAPDEIRVVLRLGAAQMAIMGEGPLRHLREDLEEGLAAGRFTVGPSDAALDLIVGTLLSAARRIVEADAHDDYHSEIVELLLRVLGISGSEAATIAQRATTTAREHQFVDD